MPGNTSFTHAIFKRLQGAYVAGINSTDGGHFDNASPMGGFCLLYPDHPNGILNKLGANAAAMGLVGLSPLAPTTNPPDSPLWQMFNTSLGPPNTIPQNVAVGANLWPVMPPPEPPGSDMATQFDPLWLEFNNGSPPPLLTAFGNWITAGKPNDYPQMGPLAQPGFLNTKPPVFPGVTSGLLFVASMPGDDGRRFGDGEASGVPLNHVPDDFWATSQIFLYDEQGTWYDLQSLPALDAGAEFYVSAVIGNSCGAQSAGRALLPTVPINVLCDAQCFNTFLSPGVSLPSMGNHDPADPNPTYEQYALANQSYEVAAFRFNVTTVFKALAAALQGINIGGATPANWLKAGHPCVKVRIVSGEAPGLYPPMGNVPLTLDSNPRYDRHIAQRNLAPFDMSLMAIHAPIWTNFIVAQAGFGTNALTIRHEGWPTDAARFYIAMPRAPYERYVAPAGHRGFVPVREGVPKPFPDAVILGQTTSGAPLIIADHDPEAARHRHGPDRFFGMALGVAGDPTRLRDHRLGDLAVVHTEKGPAGGIVGGFSLRPMIKR